MSSLVGSSKSNPSNLYLLCWSRKPNRCSKRDGAKKAKRLITSAIDRRLLLGGTAIGTATGAILASGGQVLATGSNSEGVVPRAEVGSLNVSKIVKGCWQLSGGHRGDKTSDRTVGKSAVEDFDAFVNAGITTFDTADIYGPSEELIGKYLTQRGSAEGLQVFTKLCYFGNDMNTVTDKSVDKRLKASRLRLQMDKLDLVQLYWHDYSKDNYIDAMRALYANESVSNVGITNFDTRRMSEMVDAGVPPVLNQIQYSLLDRRPENGMTDFCAKHNIKLLPYGVVAGGFLSEEYLGKPSSYVNFDTYSKRKYASIISESGGWSWFQSLLGVLDEVAKKHNTTIANIAGKWTLDRPQVVSVLIGARNAKHVSDHQLMSQIKLDQDDLGSIQKVLDQGNKAKGDCYDWERGGSW